jgi:hypothetical protein
VFSGGDLALEGDNLIVVARHARIDGDTVIRAHTVDGRMPMPGQPDQAARGADGMKDGDNGGNGCAGRRRRRGGEEGAASGKVVLRIGEVSGNGRLIVDMSGQAGGKGQNGGQGGDGGNGRNGRARACGGDEPQNGGDGGWGGIGGQGGQGGRGGNGGIVAYSAALAPLIKSKHFIVKTAAGAAGAGGNPRSAGQPGQRRPRRRGCDRMRRRRQRWRARRPGPSGAQPGKAGSPWHQRHLAAGAGAMTLLHRLGTGLSALLIAIVASKAALAETAVPFEQVFNLGNDQGIRIELDPSDDVLVFNGGTYILWGRNLEIYAGRIQVNADTIIQAFPRGTVADLSSDGAPGAAGANGGSGGPGYPGIAAGTVLIRGTSIEGSGRLIILNDGMDGGAGGHGGPGGSRRHGWFRRRHAMQVRGLELRGLLVPRLDPAGDRRRGGRRSGGRAIHGRLSQADAGRQDLKSQPGRESKAEPWLQSFQICTPTTTGSNGEQGATRRRRRQWRLPAAMAAAAATSPMCRRCRLRSTAARSSPRSPAASAASRAGPATAAKAGPAAPAA